MDYYDINKGDDDDSDALKGKRTFIHAKCYNSFNNQIQLSFI